MPRPDAGSLAEPGLEELGFPVPNEGVQAVYRQHRTPGLEGDGCPDTALLLLLPSPGAPHSPTPRLGAPHELGARPGDPCGDMDLVVVKVPLSSDGVSASVPP